MNRLLAWCGRALGGLLVVLMWASLLRPGPGWAQEAAPPPVAAPGGNGLKFSGFATVAAVHADVRDADFVGSFSQFDGVGVSRRWGLQPDTRLGLQTDLSMGSQWSASTQAVVAYAEQGRWRPSLAMGFLRWQPAPAWALRVGRLPWSAYLTSDYRRVGFSLPWVRPPQEMYMLSFDHTDGADLTWRGQWGSSNVRLQAVAGQGSREISRGEWRGRSMVGGNLLLENGNWLLRLSHLQYRRFTLDMPEVDAVLGQVAQFDPQGVDRLHFRNRSVGYSTLGLAWDDGVWLVQGELAHGTTPRTYLPDGTEAYLTVGRRFGALTPTLTLAALRDAGRRRSDNPVLQQVIALAQTRERNTLSLGLRWDARPGVALKVQLDQVRLGHGQTGLLGNLQPGFQPGGRFQVFTLAADFVF